MLLPRWGWWMTEGRVGSWMFWGRIFMESIEEVAEKFKASYLPIRDEIRSGIEAAGTCFSLMVELFWNEL